MSIRTANQSSVVYIKNGISKRDKAMLTKNKKFGAAIISNCKTKVLIK